MSDEALDRDARVIPVPGDERQWDPLLEVGSKVLARGNLAVLPTDTVYGVAGDPFNPAAVAKLFAAKARGRDLPLPVLVHSRRQAAGLVGELTDAAQALIAAWWPGPLTLVLPQAPGLGWDLGDSAGTVALRMPKQPFTLALIGRTGPLAVTSANISGEPTPAEIAGIVGQLGDHVDVYFDAGPAAAGPASTIVDLSGGRPRVLREGAIPAVEIELVLSEPPPTDGV